MATHLLPKTSKKETSHPECTGVILLVERDDQPYVNRTKKTFHGTRVRVLDVPITTITELVLAAKKNGFSHVVTTRLDILQKLLPEELRKLAKISNYAGSILPFTVKDFTLEFLIVNPLKQLVTLSYGEFLFETYVSKVTKPQNWRATTKAKVEVLKSPDLREYALQVMGMSDLVAVDIETVKDPVPGITMVGYSCFKFGSSQSFTFVLPIKSMGDVMWMRKFNETKPSKVMQNGKYDSAYFFMYGAPLYNWMWDTANLLHSWYCELPKDLGSVAALFIRNSMYWKDLSKIGTEEDEYLYCGLDTWATGEACMAWLLAAPEWARRNYAMEFTVVPACHMCEMTGIKRDQDRLEQVAQEAEEYLEKKLESIRKMVGIPNFNPSSPKQCTALLRILGEKQATSSAESVMQAVMFKHPLNERILEAILDYRGVRKLATTYLTTGDKAKEFRGRILYSLSPHATDSGRLASKEHHFWCGLQIQNMEKEGATRYTLVADDGFEIWEADYSQAEDRGVAHKSGDPSLLDIFESGKDSHSYKAAMFFGMDYEDIWDIVENKVKRGDLRQLGKRINHGANYNMGAEVLVQTMGPKKIRAAQAMLGLPAHWELKGVATFLLLAYEKAFPTVKKEYYQSIKLEVRKTSRLIGDTGWTRYCFGDPNASKPMLNAYVAHVTQSLNAMILNRAFKAVFRELGFHPDFKLLAQIHDSILFQIRLGRTDLAERVKQLMTFGVPVTDCKGVTRNMVIPVDLERKGLTWKGDK
tara:strand:- start:39248 stop:41515 length:2268 start_codon:yes stop_codon:yes gene_type:complete